MMSRPTAVLLAGALLLSACGGDRPAEESAAEAERGAKGEVIGGTISDEMIPLDRLRSQSPPVRQEQSSSSAAPTSSEQISPEPEPESLSLSDTEDGASVEPAAD
ncbi:hypothetical protein [Qipengyuania sp.]|uniref:hypothetical protein n=2 Tax=Qipengyuania sp. TaxID=2004515 RepID=UPI003BA86E5B